MIIRRANKRGVSEIIGYILLIAIVVVVSIFVFQWLKSYVPQGALNCPDGTAVSVPDYKYDCDANTFNFTLRNEGTFSIAGYFIHASNTSGTGIATLDLTRYYISSGGNQTSGIILGLGNTLDPGKVESASTNGFDLSRNLPAIAAATLQEIEIIPMRYVEYKGKERIASCGSAKISVPISCN